MFSYAFFAIIKVSFHVAAMFCSFLTSIDYVKIRDLFSLNYFSLAVKKYFPQNILFNEFLSYQVQVVMSFEWHVWNLMRVERSSQLLEKSQNARSWLHSKQFLFSIHNSFIADMSTFLGFDWSSQLFYLKSFLFDRHLVYVCFADSKLNPFSYLIFLNCCTKLY